MSTPKNHGWRADDYTLVRDGWTAQVSRAWCEDDDKRDVWRWLAWPMDGSGSITDHDIPDSVKRYSLTLAQAMAFAEKYIAERRADVDPAVYAFAGAEAGQ